MRALTKATSMEQTSKQKPLDNTGDDLVIDRMVRSGIVVQLISFLASTVGSTVNSVIVGQFLSQTGLAACGGIGPIQTVFYGIAGVFATGTLMICAKHLGKGEDETASRVYSAVTCMGFVLSWVLVAAMVVGATPIVNLLMGTAIEAELFDMSRLYLIGIVFSLPFQLLVTMMTSFSQVMGENKRVVISTVAMAVVNIVGDLLVIFVLDGSILGIGLATSASFVAAFAVLLPPFLKRSSIIRLSPHNMDFSQTIAMFRLGAPSATLKVLSTVRKMVLNRILLAVGSSVALAALSIQGSLAALFGCTDGAAVAVMLMIGGLVYGESDRRGTENALRLCLRYGVALSVLASAITFIFAGPLADIFVDDPATIAEAALCIRFGAVATPFYCAVAIYSSYLQAINRTTFAQVVMGLSGGGAIIVFAVVLSGFFGVVGVWASFLVSNVAVFVGVYAYVAHTIKRLPRRIKDFALLPDDFGTQDVLNISVHSIEEVSLASERVLNYFNSRGGYASRHSMALALCVEEMANNVVQHGFADGEKHSIDIRVLVNGNDLVVRLRDDCAEFNPIEMYQMIASPEDPAAHIGIRMVFGIAKDIKYVNTMKVNNVIITV